MSEILLVDNLSLNGRIKTMNEHKKQVNELLFNIYLKFSLLLILCSIFLIVFEESYFNL